MKLIKFLAIFLGFNSLDFDFLEHTTDVNDIENKLEPEIKASDDNRLKKTLLIAGGITLVGILVLAVLSQYGTAQSRADLSVGATKDMVVEILQANKAFIENTNCLVANNDQAVTNKLQFLITQTKRIINNQAMLSRLISMKFGAENRDDLWSNITRREKKWGDGNKLGEERQNESDNDDE